MTFSLEYILIFHFLTILLKIVNRKLHVYYSIVHITNILIHFKIYIKVIKK